MTNPMYNLPPNYSGVIIQIANPAVNLGTGYNRNGYGAYSTMPPEIAAKVNQYGTYPQACYCDPCACNPNAKLVPDNSVTNPNQQSPYPQTYPAEYYINNYSNPNETGKNVSDTENNPQSKTAQQEQFLTEKNKNLQNLNENNSQNGVDNLPSEPYDADKYRYAADNKIDSGEQDFTKSQSIIENLDNRQAEIEEAKKNTKEKRVVALTDEYIKSLENYLNNPNDEIRLMASKEILTRLDEDKDRYNDAALNALLNKMIQDPAKLVRIAALSAFASQLASGNDFTVQLLNNIQANPNADKEDVLQAADILLKMSAGTEVKNIPNPQVKEQNEQQAK